MTSGLAKRQDFKEIFLSELPMLDVRAAVEFVKGAFPAATNIPLLNDSEREVVGVRYKEQGPEEAIELGHDLVSGENKQQKLKSWQNFVKQYPDGVLYCFRGGQRSKIVQSWIYESIGINYPRVAGGYKSMRLFLLDTIDEIIEQTPVTVLGGRTGSNKTSIVNSISSGIDLEGLARHRGSAFGNMLNAQPTQINFENNLSIQLLKATNGNGLLLEDEGRNIGKIALPQVLKDKMDSAELVTVNVPMADRVQIILEDYVLGMCSEFVKVNGEDAGFSKFSEYLFDSVAKIQKRLGGARYKVAYNLIDMALISQATIGNFDSHQVWIEYLLSEYYDPMYDYQLNKKRERIIFEGTYQEVKEYLSQPAN